MHNLHAAPDDSPEYTLYAILRYIDLNGPIRYSAGICDNVEDLNDSLFDPIENGDESSYKVSSIFNKYLAFSANSWPEHSGHLSYPIPSPDPSLSPHEAYNEYDKWEVFTPYGDSRRRYIEHLLCLLERDYPSLKSQYESRSNSRTPSTQPSPTA